MNYDSAIRKLRYHDSYSLTLESGAQAWSTVNALIRLMAEKST